MAKNSIRDYSATSSLNTDVQSVDISEGCAASGINNAIREVMADIKDVSTGTIALESPQADSLTVTGDLTVDTNTLHVDASNNRVGIKTASPGYSLQIGDGTASENMRINSSATALISITSGTSSQSRLEFGDSGDDDIGYIYYDNSNNSMQFATNTSEKLRILAGGGITFNGDTAAANALNDYEEGTWTPSVRGSTTNGSFSGSNTVGFYTKIGDTVHAWFDCDGTISGAAGIIVFTGLPYASISTVEAVGQFMFDNLNVDGTRTNFVLYLGGNSTEMNIFESKDDVSWTQVSISNEAIGIRGQITYKTP